MFCVYESKIAKLKDGGKWVAEYIELGSLKVSARGFTPIDAMKNLYEIINDETGTDATIDGPLALRSGDYGEPTGRA